MGFLDGLGRFLRNEPVFPNEQAQQPAGSATPVQDTGPKQSPLVDEHGYKVIPEVTLDHIKASRSGDRETVMGIVTNHSDRVVWVEDFMVHKQKQVYKRDLGPGDYHDVKVYEGPLASNEYDSHAELKFRIKENDDGFKNVYHVEFNREADGKFTIEELHEDGPVRDI